MNTGPSMISTRAARRLTRIAIAKLYDFSYGKKAGRLCQPSGRRGAYHILLIQGLRLFVQELLSQVRDPHGRKLLGGLLGQLEILQEAVRKTCARRDCLERRAVTVALWRHRAAFGFLVKRRQPLSFSYEAWSGVALPAVVLWQGRLRGLGIVREAHSPHHRALQQALPLFEDVEGSA